MKKRILNISALLLLMAGKTFAQNADNFILTRHPSLAPADHYGQSVSKSDNYLLVGGPDDDSREDCQSRSQMAGAAVLYKDGKVLRKYLGSSSFIFGNEVGWRAGQSVAMGFDWLAVGAPKAFINQGAVLLARKDNSSGSYEFGLNFTATLSQPAVTDIGIGDQNGFGNAVAMSRNILVVGANNATYKGIACGVVFIYKLTNNSTWNLVKALVSPDFASEGDFGAAVAISDDESKIIIGAPDADGGTGAAFIYQLENNNWILKKDLRGSVHKLSDLKFGTSVDITNDRGIIGGNSSSYSDGIHSVVSFLTLTSTEGWKVEQSVYKPSVRDVAIEGTKALIGEPWYLGGEGRIVHMERTGTQQYVPWVPTSTVGLAQQFARTGYSVDLANNTAVAGVFGYDYAGLDDNCFNPTPNDETGGALYYQYDAFAGKFYKGDKPTNRTDDGTEVSAESVSSVTLSPNPASDGLVQIITNSIVTDVVAVSTSGTSKILALQGNIADISTLEAGLYVLQIRTETGTSVQKLVVK
jgi:hypothetical protein